MLRLLRYYALGCVALAMAYLAVHALEPLRLNIGDPWGDANVISAITAGSPIHFPPLPEALYQAIRRLGIEDIAGFRLFAIACSVLSLWLMFQWARRVWSEPVALIATALAATTVIWLMFADSIRQVPIVHVTGFLALWGMVRAIESGERRHHAAAFLGACGCFLAGYELWLFLPAAILMTLHVKRGTILGPGSLRFVVICAAAFALALVVKGLVSTDPIGWQVYVDRRLGGGFAVASRRFTMLYTPMLWVTLAVALWRGLRAPSWRSIVDDGTTWLLLVAAGSIVLLSRRATSPMLAAEPLLPLFSLGSAILIARLLDGRKLGRALGIAWMILAPVWAVFILVRTPHATLARDDVAKAAAYLGANDRNDFVISNLLASGPIEAAFARHTWPARDTESLVDVYRDMLDVFEATGTDYIHAVIFTDPASRSVDRSLAQLTVNRRLAAVVGWPSFVPGKTKAVIRDYDKRVLASLKAVRAKVVLHLESFDVYRVDRGSVIEAAGAHVVPVSRIDFGSYSSVDHTLLGWGVPWLMPEGVAVTSVDGFAPCANPIKGDPAGLPASNACETAMNAKGLRALDDDHVDRAQLIIRVERACDLKLTFAFGSPALVAVSMNDYTTSQCAPGTEMSLLVPQRSVRAGTNVITVEKLFQPKDSRADLSSLSVEPQCGP